MIWTSLTITGFIIASLGLLFILWSFFRKKYRQVYFGYAAIFIGAFLIIYELIS